MKTKQSLIKHISACRLSKWKDNGECREYEDLSDNDIKEIVEDFKYDTPFFEVGDKFIFIGENSRLTTGNTYEIIRIDQYPDSVNYWCWNDRSQPATVDFDKMRHVSRYS